MKAEPSVESGTECNYLQICRQVKAIHSKCLKKTKENKQNLNILVRQMKRCL